MLQFDYGYKHLKLKINSLEIIIEISCDNTLNKMVYAAKTNYLFKDEFGDWGHACGVGNSEDEALTMCIQEIENYLNMKINDKINKINLNMPKRLTIQLRNDVIILYVIDKDGGQVIVSKDNEIKIGNEDVIKFVSKNLKLFKNKGIDKSSVENLKLKENYQFFDNLSYKYKREELDNLDSEKSK